MTETDAVEGAPLAQFKSALLMGLEEENLEMYADLVKEVAAESGKSPAEVAAAAARLARRAQDPDVLERISGFELEKVKPGASSRRPSFDTNRGHDARGGGRYEPRGGARRGGPRGFGGDRGDRGGWKPVEEGMTRLFISAGKMDGVRPGDLVGAIAGETGIEGSAIGSIDIFSRYSFVEIPERHSERVLRSMNGAQVRGREVNARPATAPGEGGGFGGGGDSFPREGGAPRRGGFRRGGFRGRGGPRGGGYRGGGGGGYRGGGGGGQRDFGGPRRDAGGDQGGRGWGGGPQWKSSGGQQSQGFSDAFEDDF